jgi:hypothetical protein
MELLVRLDTRLAAVAVVVPAMWAVTVAAVATVDSQVAVVAAVEPGHLLAIPVETAAPAQPVRCM